MRIFVFSIEVVHKLVLLYKLQLTHSLVVQFSHTAQVRSSCCMLYASDLFSSAAYFLWGQ